MQNLEQALTSRLKKLGEALPNHRLPRYPEKAYRMIKALLQKLDTSNDSVKKTIKTCEVLEKAQMKLYKAQAQIQQYEKK